VSKSADKAGWARHLEGWQAGLVALSIAGVGLLTGAPRAVPPDEMPVPIPDEAALRAVSAVDQRLAAELASSSDQERAGRDFDLRDVGRLLREYGAADARRDQEALTAARSELLRSTKIIRDRDGAAPLLRLRAYQLSLFLRQLARFEQTGEEDPELLQIGGDFLGLLRQSGWVEGRTILASVPVRSALFKRRFADVLALRDADFALTMDEARALYAFLLRHPPRSLASSPDGARYATWHWSLRKVEELGAFDATYPALLARGVAYYQLGDPAAAALAFREHLAAHPDGPYTLRARNHLAAALALTAK
jgi:hypothetical protein